jgi:hypothetical protein
VGQTLVNLFSFPSALVFGTTLSLSQNTALPQRSVPGNQVPSE